MPESIIVLLVWFITASGLTVPGYVQDSINEALPITVGEAATEDSLYGDGDATWTYQITNPSPFAQSYETTLHCGEEQRIAVGTIAGSTSVGGSVVTIREVVPKAWEECGTDGQVVIRDRYGDTTTNGANLWVYLSNDASTGGQLAAGARLPTTISPYQLSVRVYHGRASELFSNSRTLYNDVYESLFTSYYSDKPHVDATNVIAELSYRGEVKYAYECTRQEASTDEESIWACWLRADDPSSD